ncbi:MAG: hypothetical protein CML17_07185, partial [Pusillimonas sp.]|nr:hypothetical protein [Pusillimonas sp.]
MELKVRAVESPGEKSTQQVEQELLDKHEQKESSKENVEETPKQETESPQKEINFEEEKQDTVEESTENEIKHETPPEETEKELDENNVLSYIEKRYGKRINSLDELTAERKEADPLPEDVAAYLKYKQETGRGIQDYVHLQQNFDDMPDNSLLRNYLKATEGEGLDDEDINALMEDYTYDSEIDDEAAIRKIKLSKKRTIAKAKKYFNEQKEKYKQPLESSSVDSPTANEELIEYRQYLESVKTQQKENESKSSWFAKKTNEIFDNDFKGFDFVLDDKKITYSPGDAEVIKKNQSTPMNFMNKFLDEKGYLKNASDYHKALSIAMNP